MRKSKHDYRIEKGKRTGERRVNAFEYMVSIGNISI